jgi:probable HAF family extracellular repeat protein
MREYHRREPMNKGWFLALLSAIALLLVSPAQLQGQASNGSVTDLGSLGSGNAIAYGVSANGGVVTGDDAGNNRGFRWTAAGGIQDLDPNANDGVVDRPYGISADGSTIVGYYGHYPECNPNCAFLWTTAGGFEILPVPGTWIGPVAYGASKDGGVVVGAAGTAYGGPNHAWLWSSNAYVDLGALPNSACGSEASAVSEGGTVVVGWSCDSQGRPTAFRWTAKTGMQSLGLLPGGTNSYATGASTNGSVIVGDGQTTNCPSGEQWCQAPFRWTKAAGKVQIPILAGKGSAVATGVSADGKTVVGYAQSNCCDWVAWRWTAATGTQAVSDWLADVGVIPPAGANFYSAYAVTANGNGVVGQLTSGDAYLALVKSNHAATPTYSPKPGTYTGAQQVTINDTAPTATIYYTTDGSTPTTSSTVYTGPITVSVTTTIKSIATVPGYPKSPVATGKYTIK